MVIMSTVYCGDILCCGILAMPLVTGIKIVVGIHVVMVEVIIYMVVVIVADSFATYYWFQNRGYYSRGNGKTEDKRPGNDLGYPGKILVLSSTVPSRGDTVSTPKKRKSKIIMSRS